ncbi:MAG TPA: hypothetical protein GX717_09300 [Clostridiaceae bacterium]|nr:hypothetical protein [Clostridiaceae bacterium]
MTHIFNLVSLISFGLAAVALAAAVIMWFRFDIARIAGELSGRTARKSIAELRQKNEERYRHQHRSNLGSKVSVPNKTESIQHSSDLVMEVTEKLPGLAADSLPAYGASPVQQESLPASCQGTVSLQDIEPSNSAAACAGTTVLHKSQTSQLTKKQTNELEPFKEPVGQTQKPTFKYIENLILTDTKDVI